MFIKCLPIVPSEHTVKTAVLRGKHTCDNFMLTKREICFSDEGDWGLNERDFLTTCSSCFSYHFHMV